MAGKNQARAISVFNKTRGRMVASEACIASTYLTRLVGLLGQTKRWLREGNGLWIVPSRGVHTIGMLFSIDLIFLNKMKEVVHLEKGFRPFRVSKVTLKARSVLELPPGAIEQSATQLGDLLEIVPVTLPTSR